METKNFYDVYFYNEMDEGEHEHWYFKSKENADKKYRQLCKKYWLKPSFCFTDKNGYTIGYTNISFND